MRIKFSFQLLKALLPRILITFIILIFIRAGTFLPVPGIDHNDLAAAIQQNLVAKNLKISNNISREEAKCRVSHF